MHFLADSQAWRDKDCWQLQQDWSNWSSRPRRPRGARRPPARQLAGDRLRQRAWAAAAAAEGVAVEAAKVPTQSSNVARRYFSRRICIAENDCWENLNVCKSLEPIHKSRRPGEFQIGDPDQAACCHPWQVRHSPNNCSFASQKLKANVLQHHC